MTASLPSRFSCRSASVQGTYYCGTWPILQNGRRRDGDKRPQPINPSQLRATATPPSVDPWVPKKPRTTKPPSVEGTGVGCVARPLHVPGGSAVSSGAAGGPALDGREPGSSGDLNFLFNYFPRQRPGAPGGGHVSPEILLARNQGDVWFGHLGRGFLHTQAPPEDRPGG